MATAKHVRALGMAPSCSCVTVVLLLACAPPAIQSFSFYPSAVVQLSALSLLHPCHSGMAELYELERLISVTYEGRLLQMRPDQLTVEVL